MSETTLTSKGQMTLPKAARDRFGLKAGDRLGVVVEEGRIVLIPLTMHVDDLCTILPASKRRASLKQMRDSVRARAAHRR